MRGTEEREGEGQANWPPKGGRGCRQNCDRPQSRALVECDHTRDGTYQGDSAESLLWLAQKPLPGRFRERLDGLLASFSVLVGPTTSPASRYN